TPSMIPGNLPNQVSQDANAGLLPLNLSLNDLNSRLLLNNIVPDPANYAEGSKGIVAKTDNKGQTFNLLNKTSEDLLGFNTEPQDMAIKPILFKTNLTKTLNRPDSRSSLQSLTANLNIKETEIYSKNSDGVFSIEDHTPKGAFLLKDIPFKYEAYPQLKVAIDGKSEKQNPVKVSVNSSPILQVIAIGQSADGKPVQGDPGEANPQRPAIQAGPDTTASDLLDVVDAAKNNNDKIAHIATNDLTKAGNTIAKENAAPVRFILPSDIHKADLKNGQTIIIKMEPENLGHIRLTLSSQHDSICGRMVVDNLAARSAVEANLGNLYDQLAKQGIKLDAFQVSLGNGQAEYEFTQNKMAEDSRRQSSWKKNHDIISGPVQKGENSTRNRMYVGATGVNWVI
ncbi:MAG: flagellar hook-length control protein FliK, partial [candidate division Zixibacteria bacterium]|nr:flagellar hook-length control protein FliK [candidate division Zixibacteria bacterium]